MLLTADPLLAFHCAEIRQPISKTVGRYTKPFTPARKGESRKRERQRMSGRERISKKKKKKRGDRSADEAKRDWRVRLIPRIK